MNEIVSIVTGANGTLGKHVCNELLKAGHWVIGIIHKRHENIEASNISLIESDLEHPETVTELINNICLIVNLNECKEINVIHLAGIYKKNVLGDESNNLNIWNEMISIHVVSFAALIDGLIKYFKQCRHGSIIAVSSNLVHRVNSDTSAYVATKGALEKYILQIAKDLGKYNITCNCIAPGYFLSKINTISPEKEVEISKNIPLGRNAKESDIGQVIMAFVLHRLSWITGQTIVVDGGNSIGY